MGSEPVPFFNRLLEGDLVNERPGEIDRCLTNVVAKGRGLGAIGNQPIARRTGTQQPEHVLETAKHEIGIVDAIAAGGEQ